MFGHLRRIFGWKDEEECESDPNLQSLPESNVSENNANRNQNSCSDSHGVPKSYETFQRTIAPINYSSTQIVSQHNALNYSSCSNVSKFTQMLSIPSAQEKQKKIVVFNTSLVVTKAKDSYIDFKIKPGTSEIPSAQEKQKKTVVSNTSLVTKAEDICIDFKIKPGTSEKSTENSQKTKVLSLSSYHTCATQNPTVNPILDNTTDPQLSHNSTSVSYKLPTFESKFPKYPPSTKSESSLLSSSFGTPLATPICLPISNKTTLPLVSSNLTTGQEKTKHIWVEKGGSPLYEVKKGLIKRDIGLGVLPKTLSPSSPKLDPSLPSSSSGIPLASPKCPTISNMPTQSQASSKSTTPQKKPKHIWVEKDASSLYVVPEDLIKRAILPRVLAEPLSPPFPISDSSLPLSSFGTPPTSPPKCSPLSNKPTLSLASSNLTTPQTKTKYIWVEKGASSLYVVPEDFKELIKRDIVPGVLRKPLSPSTYKDYFAALLYAEDYYFEKWDGFEMDSVSMELKIEHVSLELHKAEIHRRKGKYKNVRTSGEKDDKIFIEFEIEAIPEKRPFLLSRDFAYVRPSGTQAKPFQGIIYRVVKSTRVFVEFGEDFHEQHYPDCKYDVKFAFNRVCLKRAHQAIEAASDVLFRNFLFPDCLPKCSSEELLSIHPKLDWEQVHAVHRIVIHQIPPPYLLEGPLSVTRNEQLTTTGKVVQEAVVQLCRISSLNRILICAPSNSSCDVLMRSLQKELPESDIFRSNAAFRELIEVPDDILPFCPYEEEEELFPCPSLPELKKFRVILSTFMSTFRLHNEGVRAGHFSHIFLVDASSAIEPETLVPLANLANEKTAVIVTGAPGNRSRWVRSNIARQNGLLRSYFERLRNSELYMSLDPKVISQLDRQARSNLRLWEHGNCLF